MTDERPPILTGRPWPGFPCAERTGLPRLRYNPFPLSPKQSAFLLYDGPEALLGGAGGGGKSVALLAGALQFSDVPGYNAVIFRRSLTDLTLPDGLIDVSHDWLDETDAAWNGNKYRWTFPSGAVLQFAYMKSWGSERRYKSTQFQFCVERSTKIRMGDGTLKQIDAIRPGDVVATLQGPRRVLRSFHVGLKESVRLTTEWGSVVASSTHDLMLTNGTWASPKALGPTRHHSSWSRFGELWPRRSAPVERDWRSPLGPGRGRSLVRAARGEGRLPVTVSLSGDDRTAAGGFRGSLPAEARLQAWSVPEGPPSRLLQSMGSGIVHACLAHEAPRAPLGGGVSGCLDGCASGCGRCGGPLRPAPAVVPPCTPSPDGAGGLSPGRPSGDDRDCIRPRSHGETRYAHPYTMLPELAEVPFDAGTGTRMAPVGASDLWDIQVEGASHYISESGLVHRNCGFDETTEFPWEDQVLYLFSRMRTGVSSAEEAAEVYGTAPDGLTLYDVPLRLRSATNPGGPGHGWCYRRYVDKTNPDREPFLPATLDDNPGINKEEYRRMLARLPEVERQRMEEGNWDVIEIPGALWRFADIHHVEQIRVPPPVDVGVRVLALDPAVTADGDECGIVVGSLTAGEVTVEEDLSGQMHPDDWARLAVQTYHALGCTRVVCEDNQGGELVGSALRNAADALNLDRPHVVRVRATVSKEARAIPVAQAYRAGKVHHSSLLRSGSLEAQLTSWAPGISRESPDRLDAVVWLVRHLLFAEGDAVEYHNSSARQKLGTPSTGPVTRSAATALRAGSGGPRRPGRL